MKNQNSLEELPHGDNMEVIMKRCGKKFILIIILVGTFLLAGCNKFNFGIFDASKEEGRSDITSVPDEDQNGTQEDNDVTKTPDKTQGTADDVSAAGENTTPVPSSIQPNANIELTVYVVDADTGEIEPVTALIPKSSEITPELIVTTVVESMADQSIDIGIDEVIPEGDTVIVSFMKDRAPYSNLGSGYEGAILNAIAQSLIDNLTDYSKVIYRVEGKAYVSGAFEYGIDDVYMGDN